MDRAETEQKIFEKALEIMEICEAYNPGLEYFNLAISNNCISFFNEYWARDSKAPLDVWKNLNKEGN